MLVDEGFCVVYECDGRKGATKNGVAGGLVDFGPVLQTIDSVHAESNCCRELFQYHACMKCLNAMN